ncbi:hypothetical protein P692DRAFT_20877849 [Suillus brevipes Sb2]|nr:hypothetical protein P692DRAFT_20877849 [Suillus brevipes Sb2]
MANFIDHVASKVSTLVSTTSTQSAEFHKSASNLVPRASMLWRIWRGDLEIHVDVIVNNGATTGVKVHGSLCRDIPSHLAPTYLGWGAPPSVKEVAAGNVNDNDDGPTYDLGWGQPVDTPTVGDVALAAKTINLDDDVIDLTSDDIVSQATVVDRNEDIIDLTEDDGPTYDLGWDAQPLSPLSPVTSQPSNEEMDAPDGDTTGAELLHRINWRLKMIGSTMVIVENAIHGSTDDQVPAAILLENRQLLGWFSDTRN